MMKFGPQPKKTIRCKCKEKVLNERCLGSLEVLKRSAGGGGKKDWDYCSLYTVALYFQLENSVYRPGEESRWK